MVLVSLRPRASSSLDEQGYQLMTGQGKFDFEDMYLDGCKCCPAYLDDIWLG
jgi:hypothetical protein